MDPVTTIAALGLMMVTAVHDGDTFTCVPVKKTHGVYKPAGEEIKVRLYGVDAPELKQEGGKDAKAFLEDIALKEIVTLEPKAKSYGRQVCRVYLGGKLDLGAVLVAEGHGWWVEKYAPKEQVYRYLQNHAKAFKHGLWSSKKPQAPWEYRIWVKGLIKYSKEGVDLHTFPAPSLEELEKEAEVFDDGRL